MTVKCFSELTKDAICYAYINKTRTITELAKWHFTSTRTIGRVLEERGLATPVPRLKGEAHAAMKVLAEFNLTAQQLRESLLSPAPTRESVQTYLNDCSEDEFSDLVENAAQYKDALLLTNHDQQQREMFNA